MKGAGRAASGAGCGFVRGRAANAFGEGGHLKRRESKALASARGNLGPPQGALATEERRGGPRVERSGAFKFLIQLLSRALVPTLDPRQALHEGERLRGPSGYGES